MRLSRFERKILLAILVVSLAPLLGALVLGNEMLSDAYQDVLSSEWHGELVRGVDARRNVIVALREQAERTVDAIAYDSLVAAESDDSESGQARLGTRLAAFIDRYPEVASIRVLSAEGSEQASVTSQHGSSGESSEHAFRIVQRERDLEDGRRVEVEFRVPLSVFHDFQSAGEAEEVFARLRESQDYISNFYLIGYIALLISIIAVALALGVTLTRRVTRRVLDLANAIRRVGAGDLAVQVEARGDDEIEELTESFNEMVRTMRESRLRIEYLQRIGAWQDFARRLAHEIKNPLTPIQLAAQEMRETYRGEDEKYRGKLGEAVTIIEEEVATLRRLVGEFSDFAKLPEVTLEPADLVDLLRDLERGEAFLGAAASRDDEEAIEVDLEVAPELQLPVQVDAMMFKRCLDNLIRNGRQAIRKAGQGEGRITVRALAERGLAVVEVSDNGPGVPREQRQKIFDPYFTTKEEGTGLGLAIVKKVILEHGGEIRYVAGRSAGATFRVEIPQDQARDANSLDSP